MTTQTQKQYAAGLYGITFQVDGDSSHESHAFLFSSTTPFDETDVAEFIVTLGYTPKIKAIIVSLMGDFN